MFKIPQIRIEFDIFIRRIITIHIANDSEIRRVGNPQLRTMPRQALDRIEPCREDFGCVRFSITVVIQDDHNTIARGFRFRITVLRSHSNEQAALFVESH